MLAVQVDVNAKIVAMPMKHPTHYLQAIIPQIPKRESATMVKPLRD